MRFPPPDPPGSLPAAALHLAGLSSLAVAQPLFDLLARNAEFFAVRGSSRWEIVLFAVGVVALPPLALLAATALAGLLHPRAATVAHLAGVAALLATLVLHAARGVDAPATALLAVAAAVGALGALLYARARPARMLLSVVGVAPAVFVGLFLLGSPVSRLVTSDPPAPRLASAPSETPVVVVVLDELPTVSLMDADGGIDAGRYPNFARLAADATWYRNATTVHEWTTGAVPPMLTGRRSEGRLPLYLDHPDNLFTLLGGSHRLRVFETQTHLCPAALCDEDRPPLAQRAGSLLADLSVVYGHLALPGGLRERLPSISGAWSGFGEDGPAARIQEGPSLSGRRPAAYTGRDAEVEEFVAALAPADRPLLAFLHVLLPHHPWEYLPSGKAYASDLGFQPGLVEERWTGDPELAVQAQQRHLLQVGYVDRVLGRILDRLEETGQYERALLVVVADHGLSFRPGGERRRVHAGNLEEIAFVPLFVKAPDQPAGRVVDDHVRTIDLLPTVADLLGVDVPWETDGRSIVAPGFEPEEEVAVHTSSGEVVTLDAALAVARRDRVLERQIERFGEGDEAGLYAVGPRPELVGRPVDGLLAATANGPEFESYGDTVYDPASPVAPVRIYGRLHDAAPGQDVAVALNGRIVAVTRSFEHGGETLVSAVAPEDAFDPGENVLQLFGIEGPPDAAELHEIPVRP